jgi:hypothetical protein
VAINARSIEVAVMEADTRADTTVVPARHRETTRGTMADPDKVTIMLEDPARINHGRHVRRQQPRPKTSTFRAYSRR